MIKHIATYQEFLEERKEGTVLVDFYADWCGPCQMLSPIIEKVSDEHEVKVLKVNVDEVPEAAAEFAVYSIPTLLLFEAGKAIKKNVGFIPEPSLKHFLGL